MRIRRIGVIFLLFVMTFAMLFATSLQTSALENKYYIDQLQMSIKLPKDYNVVTINSERDDEVFSTLSLDYDETMTAFYAANIYLQAYDAQNKHKITLTMVSDEDSKAVNNYSDITAAQRQSVLESFLADENCTEGVEKKYGGNIFFELSIESKSDDKTIYTRQCNTVINGMNINLTLQKDNEKPSNDELKVLSNAANSMTFDKITLNSGPRFDWWRILLWIFTLAVILGGVSLWHKHKTEANKRKLQERRMRSRAKIEPMIPQHPEFIEEIDKAPADVENAESNISNPLSDSFEEITFDESLGYGNTDEFLNRASTDLESYDISVKEKDPNNGISYFEDDGKSIDNEEDYFDTYFKKQETPRKASVRFFSSIWNNIRILFRHIGYFFKNLVTSISSLFNTKKTNKKK